jgi:hypothetical protein
MPFRCRSSLWVVALCACAQGMAWCAPVRGEEFPPADDFDFAPAAPLVEDDWRWLPQWTMPHPELCEQLWRPGDLIEDTYFLRRPWHAGFFFGTMDGDRLAAGVDQASDWFGGVRIGNDFAPRWGWELRSAYFSPDLTYFDQPDRGGMAQNWFLDMNVLHYPWGDTRIRPFWSIGLGSARFRFEDAGGGDVNKWVVDLPLSVGVKYHWKDWLAVRGELTDTIILGQEPIHAMHNLSLSFGAEIHWHSFKTRPVRYGY